MKKKEYISPGIYEFVCNMQPIAASTLDPTKDDQNITPTEDPYEGEYTTRRHDVWDDDQEDDE